MAAYYNEHDPYAAQWLRNLIQAGHIAPGDVDERSIVDVRADDIKSYTQCHFFAGIGVWSHALRWAGWADDRPVWTGSCPCQPFSTAGGKAGMEDKRHLWPELFRLINTLRPPVFFGEQVEAAIKYGWLDTVQDDMEGSNYTFAAVGIPAAGLGSPHIRQRLWFVGEDRLVIPNQYLHSQAIRCSDGVKNGKEKSNRPYINVPRQSSRASGIDAASWWSNAEWITCSDGKSRPIEPGTCPVVDGTSRSVEQLRAYGNAIVPQVASAFIASYMELLQEDTTSK